MDSNSDFETYMKLSQEIQGDQYNEEKLPYFDLLGFRLVQTCFACPEQYDVYLNGEYVAYFRLRHGTFRAEVDGEIVYTASTQGDGIFSEEERESQLTKALILVRLHLDQKEKERRNEH